MSKKELKRIVRKLRRELKEERETVDELLCENIKLNEDVIYYINER